MNKIVLAVFPPRGATFSSFSEARFVKDVVSPIRLVLDDSSLSSLIRVIVFISGEECVKGWPGESDGPPGHDTTPTYLATYQYLNKYRGHVIEPHVLTRAFEDPAILEREAASHAWGQGASGMISWFVEGTPLICEEVFSQACFHTAHTLTSGSRLVTRLGVEIKSPASA